MRRAAVALAALLLVACTDVPLAGASRARPALHATPQVTVLFADSFNGSSLDLTKWNNGWFGDNVHPTKAVNGAGEACNDPAQVNVGGGQLHITATKRSCLGYAWASGLVNTNGHFAFTTGTFKAKVCLPPGAAMPTDDWPAIWTDGQRWPNNGEIDLLEGLHGSGQAHVHDINGTQPAHGGYGNLAAGCHRIRYVRTASAVTFYYDGAKQGTASTSAFSTSPHYLVLELAVSNSISPPAVAAQLHVDWVQVTT